MNFLLECYALNFWGNCWSINEEQKKFVVVYYCRLYSRFFMQSIDRRIFNLVACRFKRYNSAHDCYMCSKTKADKT